MENHHADHQRAPFGRVGAAVGVPEQTGASFEPAACKANSDGNRKLSKYSKLLKYLVILKPLILSFLLTQ